MCTCRNSLPVLAYPSDGAISASWREGYSEQANGGGGSEADEENSADNANDTLGQVPVGGGVTVVLGEER